jgi:hypothetical protein
VRRKELAKGENSGESTGLLLAHHGCEYTYLSSQGRESLNIKGGR